MGLSALRSFVLRILSERAEGAPMLCSKEPYNLRYGLLLDRMFPNSKFVFVVRDGRAVCRDPIRALNECSIGTQIKVSSWNNYRI